MIEDVEHANSNSGRTWVELLAVCSELFGPSVKLRTILVLVQVVRLGEASCKHIIGLLDLPHNAIRHDLKRLGAIDRHGHVGLRMIREERDRITGELYYRPRKAGLAAVARMLRQIQQ